MCLFLTGCENDSNKFKEEYESLNGKTFYQNYKYKDVTIPEDNPIKYSNYKEIIDIVKNGSGVIYLGYPECPWCRSMVSVLMEAANNTNISTIYYLNMHDVRDEYELSDDTYEEIALQNDNILNQFLESGTLTDDTIRQMIQKRQIFPCYFGSALKISGIDEFLQGFENWTNETQYDNDFGAKVFKISHDENDERLTWIKVTGGVLHNKDVLFEDQKANQVRIYNGAKFELQQNIPAGGICAVTGLTNTFPG